MRRRLCDTLHGRPSQLLIALPAAVVDRWPTVRPESRFVPPPTAFDVPVREGGVPSEYCHDVWCGKPEWFAYPLLVLTELTNVTDGHTDVHTHTHRHRMTA